MNINNPYNFSNSFQVHQQMQFTQNNIEALIQAVNNLVAQLQKPALTPAQILWTKYDIAEYLKLSVNAVDVKVICQPSFPKAFVPCMQIDTNAKKTRKRWFAEDVINWARQYNYNLPHKD